MRKALNLTVLIAGLGYFVDMFDLTLFGVVRTPSLKALGLTTSAELLNVGVFLFDLQMLGMLLGGVLWGILGDKKGRLSVLYGSILMYSLANLGNAFVTTVPMYAVFRFLAGFGLAGELGAAITLVSEVMSKESRGYGTTLVATLGLCGSVGAALVGKYMDWKVAYLVGGCLGFGLLISRMKMFESGMFAAMKTEKVRRGDMKLLFQGARLERYVCCVLIGIPIWFITGILMTFSPELTSGLGLTGPISAADALLYGSVGLALGDLASGLLSQFLESRKKALAAFLITALVLTVIYTRSVGFSPTSFYVICFLLGICAGYWAVFVTIAAEQFGTNIRSTVATTVPNFVRGSALVVALSFSSLKSHFTIINSALIVGGVCFALAFIGLYRLNETYGKDLDFVER